MKIQTLLNTIFTKSEIVSSMMYTNMEFAGTHCWKMEVLPELYARSKS